MRLHVIEGSDGDSIELPAGTETFTLMSERTEDGLIEIAILAEEKPRGVQ